MSFLGQSYNAQATNPSVIMLAIMMLPDIDTDSVCYK